MPGGGLAVGVGWVVAAVTTGDPDEVGLASVGSTEYLLHVPA